LIEFDLKLTNFKSDALPTALGEHYNAHVLGYSNKFKQAKNRIEKRETKTQAKNPK